ncbi:MAG: polymerase [Variovorax paradoxus]|nr:MAG: polymerase [Variovorax paradoxus]PZQ11113.1 MAG: polymerase [Variovorax paradoxus]
MISARLSALGLLVFGLSWLAYDHYRPWASFHSEALACAGLLFLFAGQLARPGPLQVPAIARWLLLAALAPWLWWAVGIGLFAGDALLCSMYLLAVAAAVCVGYRWAQPASEWLYALAWFTALVAGLSATIGLLQWLQLSGPFGMYMVQSDPGDRAMGNIGQPNQLGTLLLMGVAALLLLFEARRLGRLAFAVCVAYLTMGLVLTSSRAALLSVVVVTGFLLSKKAHLRMRPAALLGWALAALSASLMLPWVAQALLISEGRGLVSMAYNADRTEIWAQVLAGILQSPWMGHGWNQTPTAHVAGAWAVPGTLTYGYAHNLVLDLMAWNGAVFGLLWAGLLAWWLASRMVAVRVPAAIAALAGLLPLAVHSMVEHPFTYAYFLVMGGLLAGVVEAFHVGARHVQWPRRWALALAMPWAAAGAYVCHEYLLIEEDFRIVRFENLRIGQTPADYVVPQIHLLSHMGAMLHAARLRPEPGMAQADIERLRRVTLRFPWSPLHLRYAFVLALNGDPQGAARQLHQVRAMFGVVYYDAARLELSALEQRYPQARGVLELL